MNVMDSLRFLERKHYNSERKARLINTKFTIIASNCVGTMIYQDMGLPVCSPTINLTIPMNDFVRFAEKLEWYLKQTLCRIEESGVFCPVGALDDVKIYFTHYDTWERAARKWRLHSRRVDLNRLFFIGCEKDGCTYETLERFERLPLRNRVILTKKAYPEFSSAFPIRGLDGQGEMGDLTAFRKGFWLRRYMDDFDYIEFLNERGPFNLIRGEHLLRE